jgi:hypothetical protein
MLDLQAVPVQVLGHRLGHRVGQRAGTTFLADEAADVRHLSQLIGAPCSV